MAAGVRPGPSVVVDAVPVVRAIVLRGVLRLAVSVEEAAELLFGESSIPAQKRVLNLIHCGELSAATTGRKYLISSESLVCFLNAVPAT